MEYGYINKSIALIVILIIVAFVILIFVKPRKHSSQLTEKTVKSPNSECILLQNYINRYNGYISDYNLIISEFQIEKTKILTSIMKYNDNSALISLKQVSDIFDDKIQDITDTADSVSSMLQERRLNYVDIALGSIATNISDLQKNVAILKSIPITDCTKQYKDATNPQSETYQSYNNKNTENVLFFDKCSNIMELEKRYRNLTKAFHPDNEWGNKDLFLKMQEEYERKHKDLERLL